VRPIYADGGRVVGAVAGAAVWNQSAVWNRNPVSCEVLSEPKAGSSESEYEDAWYLPRGLSGKKTSGARGCTIAVADGASESMLAGAWAGMVARAVGTSGRRELDAGLLADRICAAAAKWPAYVNRYVRRRERAGRPVAWYEESKLEQGAHATVLGVCFRWRTAAESGLADTGGTWSAAALGDACAFQVRDERLAEAFPIEGSADFDTSPHLAGTRAPDRDLLAARCVGRRGTWLPGDVFYLATDAAAQWFLAEAEARRQPWRQVDEAFKDPAAWLADLRAERRIRNDDVTIVRCRLGLIAWNDAVAHQ
jgi:hypothetical protein